MEKGIIFLRFHALRTLFHIEGEQIFEKGAISRPFKQPSLEQEPSHNTR